MVDCGSLSQFLKLEPFHKDWTCRPVVEKLPNSRCFRRLAPRPFNLLKQGQIATVTLYTQWLQHWPPIRRLFQRPLLNLRLSSKLPWPARPTLGLLLINAFWPVNKSRPMFSSKWKALGPRWYQKLRSLKAGTRLSQKWVLNDESQGFLVFSSVSLKWTEGLDMSVTNAPRLSANCPTWKFIWEHTAENDHIRKV